MLYYVSPKTFSIHMVNVLVFKICDVTYVVKECSNFEKNVFKMKKMDPYSILFFLKKTCGKGLICIIMNC